MGTALHREWHGLIEGLRLVNPHTGTQETSSDGSIPEDNAAAINSRRLLLSFQMAPGLPCLNLNGIRTKSRIDAQQIHVERNTINFFFSEFFEKKAGALVVQNGTKASGYQGGKQTTNTTQLFFFPQSP
jgi:hypothetical protein